MEFKEFKKKLQENFFDKIKNVDTLYLVDVDKDEMVNLYLDSFPPGTNKIFRERREFDCSACKQFIKNFGNVVFFNEARVMSIWDFQIDDPKYQAVLTAMTNFIRTKEIKDVFITRDTKFGIDANLEMIEGGVNTWEHLYIEIPQKFKYKGRKSEDSIKSELRSTKNVFLRSLREISQDSIETVLDLIYSNTLYKGEEWKKPLEKFLEYKKEFDCYETFLEEDDYAWRNFQKAGEVVSKMRNHSIGTLLVNVTEHMDLDTAVRKYEDIVAPHNYKRSKPIYTQKMLERAKATVEELEGKSTEELDEMLNELED